MTDIVMKKTEEAEGSMDQVTTEELVEKLQENPKLQEFVQMVNDLGTNVDFLVDDAWVDHAIKGLKKPNVEGRTESQLYTTVRKQLRDKAADDAEETGEYIAPSDEEIQVVVDKKIADRRRNLQVKRNRKISKAKAEILAVRK